VEHERVGMEFFRHQLGSGSVVNDKKFQAFRGQMARLFVDFYRNQDYYNRHDATEWQVLRKIVRFPDKPKIIQYDFPEAGKYVVYTRIRAKEKSPLNTPANPGKEIKWPRLKAEANPLMRTLTGGRHLEDALEPIFGLNLPPSDHFDTKEEAEDWAKKQQEMIETAAAEAYPDRIQVVEK
jgi:hypothetical protein